MSTDELIQDLLSLIPASQFQLENSIGILYLIFNKINGKCYVGKTVQTFNQRYKNDWLKYERHNLHVMNAIRFYNPEDFGFYVKHENCSNLELLDLEKHYIKRYKSNDSDFGYNKTPGGEIIHSCEEDVLRTKFGKRETRNHFIERCKFIHDDKYDYSRVNYTGYKNKIEIFCKRCQKFFYQKAVQHIAGQGCNLCKNERASETKMMSLQDFTEKSMDIFGDKYYYHDFELKNNILFTNLTCKIHNLKFTQNRGSHLQGKEGCKICLSQNYPARKTFQSFLDKANLIHNYKYMYNESTYSKRNSKMEIQCKPCNIKFQQTPKCHLQGRGCPNCALESTISPKRKKVKQIDKNTNEVINIFNSLQEAANYLGVKNKNLSTACKGKRKTWYGFKWEYADAKDIK
jgi:hypothetical protein